MSARAHPQPDLQSALDHLAKALETRDVAELYHGEARAIVDALDGLERENAQLRELVGDAVPALGCHARDFSQRALIAACEVTGGDPADWSHHPDVLARLLAVSGRETLPASGDAGSRGDVGGGAAPGRHG